MTVRMKILLAAAMMAIGVAKALAHTGGTVDQLTLATCTGRTVTLALGETSFLASAHCWGCYLALAGLVLLASTLLQQRRWASAPVRPN